MNTIFDFVSQTKGMEYLLAIIFLAGYVVFMEVLKPRPFQALAEMLREDMGFMTAPEGRAALKRLAMGALMAPLVVAKYFAMLPLMFALGVALKAEESVASTFAGGTLAWRPIQSYLLGRGRKEQKARKTTVVHPADKQDEAE